MSKTATVKEPVVLVGEVILATREIKGKGPGTRIAQFSNQAEAEQIRDYLVKNHLVAAGHELTLRAVEPVKVFTASAWLATEKEKAANEKKKQEALAALTPEQRKILGL